MFGRKGQKGNYAYAVARVKAKKAGLMGNDSYQKMMMMNLTEISRFISESGYAKEITDLTGKFDGIDLIEHATYKNMARLLKGVLESTTGELHDTLAADLDRWDIWNLKVILRGKSFGIDMDSIKEDLVPAGSLNSEKLETLASLETSDDIMTQYTKMTGVAIPQDVLDAYKEKGNLQPIEDFLDKQHYEKLLMSIDANSRPKRLYQDYVRMSIDAINVETILKLKMEGVDGEEVMKYFISGGKNLDKKRATQIANTESFSAALNELSQGGFFEIMKIPLDENASSLKDIVAAMKKYKMEMTKSFSHLHPLSIIPIIDYLIHKENEVNNIRIVARGIESGLDRDTINSLLVI